MCVTEATIPSPGTKARVGEEEEAEEQKKASASMDAQGDPTPGRAQMEAGDSWFKNILGPRFRMERSDGSSLGSLKSSVGDRLICASSKDFSTYESCSSLDPARFKRTCKDPMAPQVLRYPDFPSTSFILHPTS